MKKVYNVNIESQAPLPTPNEIHSELPIPAESEDFVRDLSGSVQEVRR